jgi:hypothetical protein
MTFKNEGSIERRIQLGLSKAAIIISQAGARTKQGGNSHVSAVGSGI